LCPRGLRVRAQRVTQKTSPAFTPSSLRLRQRSVAAAAEVTASMRIAQPRDTHLVDKACGLAEILPLADPRFPRFPGEPFLHRVDFLRRGRRRRAGIDGGLGT